MGISQKLGLCIVALAAGSMPSAAQTVTLFPAQVSGANIDCMFSAQCSITPHDELTDIPMPGISGKAILQSRTFLGAPGATAAGRTAYQYRIDLTSAVALGDVSCILSLSVDFGPVAKLPYAPGPQLRDVYEILQGVPPNQIGFSSATQTGAVVTFTFARPVCAGDGNTPGATTFAFGLASLDAPVRGVRVRIAVLGLDVAVSSFGPRR